MDKIEILTSLQKKVMSHLFSDEWFRRYFYLTGGTALSAFYLHHRLSDDLDFFSHGVELDSIPKLMDETAKKLDLPLEKIRTSVGFMRFSIGDGLKIDVVADTDFRVGSPELVGEYMVDSLKNIAVNKVCAILGRLDTKDYIDTYFLLKERGFDIFELLSLGQKRDAGMELFVWASLIADVKQLSIMPKMLRPVSLDDVKIFFLELRDRILDKIKPQ